MSSCEGLDPTSIMETIDGYEQRIARLEARCDEMNKNITALQTIATAVDRGDYITSINPILETDSILGYTITFAKAPAIEIFHGAAGIQGERGEKGEDGATPVIGVAESEGVYYWTIDGEWLLDKSGAKIQVTGPQGEQGPSGADGENGANGADGNTPKLKIEDNYWFVSYDNGASWQKLAKSIEEIDPIFSSVVDNGDSVTFELSAGGSIVIPKDNGYPIRFTSFGEQEIKGLDNVVVAQYDIDYEEIDFVYVNYEVPDLVFTKSVEGWKAMCEVSAEDKDIRVTVTPYLNIDKVIIHLTMVLKGGASYTISKRLKAMPVYFDSVGHANCYLISRAGTYSIPTVKGNSYEPVGNIASVEVLWASFGTDVMPEEGELVRDLSYYHGMITFTAMEKQGNAVIAAKDAEGKILWSWHIWLTDEPKEEAYRNFAGVMMDRDLGATSATPGDPKALGLMYQWGRKDPFLGGSSYKKIVAPACTNVENWQIKTVEEFIGIQYAIEHPMTLITSNNTGVHNSWIYDDTRENDAKYQDLWNKEKTIYDPCPAGYRVPDGGPFGVWATALGESKVFTEKMWDSTNHGMSFVNDGLRDYYMVSSGTCWYTDSGSKNHKTGAQDGQGSGTGSSYWWSCTVSAANLDCYRYYFYYNSAGVIRPSDAGFTASAHAVRCFKEHSTDVN